MIDPLTIGRGLTFFLAFQALWGFDCPSVLEGAMISISPIVTRGAWLTERKGALTASDIGAVAGVDQYKSPLRVYAEKTTDVDIEESPIMRRGRLFEMAAIGYLQEDHPDWVITRPNAFYTDVDLKLGATPDCFAKNEAGGLVNIQIKTVSLPVFESWEGEPPASYLLQTACENMLVKADEGILAVLVVSAYTAELHEFPVPRHAAAEKRICELARQFWANIAKGLVPRPNYTMDGEVIAGLWPPNRDKPVPLDLNGDNRIIAVLEEREVLKADIKAALADVAALDAEIVHKLQGATLAIVNGYRITNTVTNRKEFTVPAKSFPVLRVTNTEAVQ